MSLSREMEETRQKAERLLKTLKPDRSRLDPRLPPGLIDGLAADSGLLLDKAAGAGTAKTERKSATQDQTKVAGSIVELVMAMRSTLKRHKLDGTILSRAGVGKKVSVAVVKSVVEAADDLIRTCGLYPDQVRGAGVLPADVERLCALRAQLITVDVAQEGAKVTAKEMIAARNAAHKRVKAAIASIVGVAELAFVGDPERIAAYQAHLPTRSTTRKAPAPRA